MKENARREGGNDGTHKPISLFWFLLRDKRIDELIYDVPLFSRQLKDLFELFECAAVKAYELLLHRSQIMCAYEFIDFNIQCLCKDFDLVKRRIDSFGFVVGDHSFCESGEAREFFLGKMSLFSQTNKISTECGSCFNSFHL